MRAREFVMERRAHLDPSQEASLSNTYVIPSLSAQDPYRTYRFGMALARARSVNGDDLPEFSEEGAFGEMAVISGLEDVDELVNRALVLAGIKGGKTPIGSKVSHEIDSINKTSPVKAFRGYPR
jgi:hypothetical protein